jgi:RNA polymerase sigma-70 factor (ECF subfamily)
MALPFDLRVFAAAAADGSDDSGGCTGRADGVHGRPSRAIVILPEIVAGVREHDVEAFQELVRLTYVPLARFARTILGSREEAEDVVQGVFAMIWERPERWQPSTDPAAYLFRSVRNQALDEVRRHERATRRAERVQGGDAHGDASQDQVDTVLDRLIEAETRAERAQRVALVLETFTERQRTAYDLRYRRGLTASGIADVLGITVKSAEQLISRVTHLMIDRLQGSDRGRGRGAT